MNVGDSIVIAGSKKKVKSGPAHIVTRIFTRRSADRVLASRRIVKDDVSVPNVAIN